jgi:hypothetical protein
MFPLFAFVTKTLPLRFQPDAHKDIVIFYWILNFLNSIFFQNLYFVFLVLTIIIYLMFHSFILRIFSGVKTLSVVGREYGVSCVDHL